MNYYRLKAFSDEIHDVNEALFILINKQYFCLNEQELNNIERKFNNEKISGWVFAYKAYAATVENRNRMLKENLQNTNPRIREQVCDIVGDEFIDELRDDLKLLFNDPVSYVAEAAKYNHDEMF